MADRKWSVLADSGDVVLTDEWAILRGSGNVKAKAQYLVDLVNSNLNSALVKTAYENNADTNAFTDSEKTKLAGLTPSSVDFSGLLEFIFVPNSLSQVGNANNSTGANPLCAVIDVNTIAYHDSANDQLRTYSWDGTDWTQIGNALSLPTSVKGAMTSFATNTIAHVDASLNTVATYFWDGTNWAQVGNSFSPGSFFNPAVAGLTATEIAYFDTSNDLLQRLSWDGTNWSVVGNSTLITGAGSGCDMTALDSNTVVLCDQTTDTVRTLSWNGTDWLPVGNTFQSGGGEPYMAALNATSMIFGDRSSGATAKYTWDGTDWTQVGDSISLVADGRISLSTLDPSNIVAATQFGGIKTYEFLEGDGIPKIFDVAENFDLWAVIAGSGNFIRVSGSTENDGLFEVLEILPDFNTFRVASVTPEAAIQCDVIATADALTEAEVKTLYENNADTNAFTDAEKSKLAGLTQGITEVAEDTTPTLGGTLDAGTFSITNMANPVNPQDAATKDYVDNNDGGITEVVEDTTPTLGGNLDANSQDISNVNTLTLINTGSLGFLRSGGSFLAGMTISGDRINLPDGAIMGNGINMNNNSVINSTEYRLISSNPLGITFRNDANTQTLTAMNRNVQDRIIFPEGGVFQKAAFFSEKTLADAANISWDARLNQTAEVTLAGNRTLDNPTNMDAGATYILVVKQDATGGRTLAFGTAYKWPGGTAPTLTAAANAVDIITFYSDGTNMYGIHQGDFQ